MGRWSFYFITKVILFFSGLIGFNFIDNFLLAVFLIFSKNYPRAKIARQVFAIPVAIALLYNESFLPSIRSIFLKMNQLKGFSLDYFVELSGRVFSWKALLFLVLLIVIYYFLSKKIKMGTIAVLAILSTLLPISNYIGLASQENKDNKELLVSDKQLTYSLNTFFESEAKRTGFIKSASSSNQLDLIVISVCSLSWDDIEYVKAQNNPLFKRFNYLFTNFNSAATYSGPAIIRLLRSSRGQQNYAALYKPPVQDSLLFENFQKTGYQTQLAMNHSGQYDNLLSEIRDLGGIESPLFDNGSAVPYLKGFDDTTIYDDYSVLSRWWENRLKIPNRRVALFYNTISLHDGNRSLKSNVYESSLDTYPRRLSKLMSDLDRFYQLVQNSNRNAVIVFVPEHGAAIRREANKISGMREIPSPVVTKVPVGVMFAGKNIKPPSQPITITSETSYLALSDLVSHIISSKSSIDADGGSLNTFVKNIPQTRFVAQNEDMVVMEKDGAYYFRSNDINWSPFSIIKNK